MTRCLAIGRREAGKISFFIVQTVQKGSAGAFKRWNLFHGTEFSISNGKCWVWYGKSIDFSGKEM